MPAPARVLLLAAALGAVGAVRTQAAVEKKDWAQLRRYRAENAALAPAAAGEARVVFFGDSITDQWGRAAGTGEFFPGRPYVNRGVSGQTTPQLLVRFRQDVVNLRPRAVVILAGTNDVAENTGPMSPEETEGNLRSMVELARASGIRAVLATILPVGDFPWRRGLKPAGKIRALNAWIRDYCATGAATPLDYYSALADADGAMKPGLSFDGVHPNARGYALMAPLASAAVARALRANPK